MTTSGESRTHAPCPVCLGTGLQIPKEAGPCRTCAGSGLHPHDLSATPSEDRVWELMEMAYGDSGGITVLGWADNGVAYTAEYAPKGQTFDVVPVPESHEDKVLVIAIRVPHPDVMDLDEVVGNG